MTTRVRPISGTLVTLTVLIATTVLAKRALLVQNVTPSLPLGLYRASTAPLAIGAIVALRQPRAARAYLSGLGYPARALLLKRVVAVGGDTACSEARALRLRGDVRLPRSSRDGLGRRLPAWRGCRSLSGGELLVAGDSARSFDSRYFGPVARTDVVGVYERLP